MPIVNESETEKPKLMVQASVVPLYAPLEYRESAMAGATASARHRIVSKENDAVRMRGYLLKSVRSCSHSHPLYTACSTNLSRTWKMFPFWESPPEARENAVSTLFRMPPFPPTARMRPRQRPSLPQEQLAAVISPYHKQSGPCLVAFRAFTAPLSFF